MYLMLMKASCPPCFSNNSSVSAIKSPISFQPSIVYYRIGRAINEDTLTLPLAIVDAIANVNVLGTEKIEDWKNLSVIGNKGLPYHVS